MDCDYIFNKLWNNSACKETNLQVPRLHLWLVNADHQKPMGGEIEVIVVLEHVQEFGCLTGILKRAQWANDYAIAHVVLQNLRWHYGCGVRMSARIGELLLCLWARQCGPDGQMTTMLHIHIPR